jgi:hypothetical protein
MHACVRVCVIRSAHVHQHTLACVYVRVYVLKCMYVYMSVCMYVCACVYVCVRVNVLKCMYMYMLVCMHVCTCARMCARVHVCKCMYVCVCVCMHEAVKPHKAAFESDIAATFHSIVASDPSRIEFVGTGMHHTRITRIHVYALSSWVPVCILCVLHV